MISLHGGTDTQKIQALSDTSYYTKRYERTDEEVLESIRNSENNCKTASIPNNTAKESTKKVFGDYTKEEMDAIVKANSEKFASKINIANKSMSLEKMASESTVENDFLKEMASDM